MVALFKRGVTGGGKGRTWSERWESIGRTRTHKARLHLQFLLRFQVRFSPSDRCKRVD